MLLGQVHQRVDAEQQNGESEKELATTRWERTWCVAAATQLHIDKSSTGLGFEARATYIAESRMDSPPPFLG